jgi:hypothetical protein
MRAFTARQSDPSRDRYILDELASKTWVSQIAALSSQASVQVGELPVLREAIITGGTASPLFEAHPQLPLAP